jgi:CobQ-like glutamine amidotransferase family enzyme
MAVSILHLYPRELGINGDVGNVMALQTRARWHGIEATVRPYSPGDELPEDVDLVHIGSGPVSAQRAVYSDLMRVAGRLRELQADGVPFLAIAGGWQLLGEELVTDDGERLTGAGVFPSRTVLRPERVVGEIAVRTADGIVTGFENHSGATTLQEGATAFGTVLAGTGNRAEAVTRLEGVRHGASIGTHLHGALLTMNPSIADHLLEHALDRRGGALPAAGDTEPLARADEYAARSRAAILARLGVAERQPR